MSTTDDPKSGKAARGRSRADVWLSLAALVVVLVLFTAYGIGVPELILCLVLIAAWIAFAAYRLLPRST